MTRTDPDLGKHTAEVRALIEEHANPEAGPYQSAVVAKELVAHLRREDPDLLREFLHEQAESVIRQMINTRDRSRRAHARLSASSQRFLTAIAEHEAGDDMAIVRWNEGRRVRWLETVHVVDDGNTRKQLADMDGPDCVYASARYAQRETQERLMKIFLREVAKRIGTDRAVDHFSEDQLNAMWTNLGGMT